MKPHSEISQYNNRKLILLWLLTASLAGLFLLEGRAYIAGKPSWAGLLYIVFLSGLVIWRYGVRYEYVVTDTNLQVTSWFLGLSRTLVVELDAVVSYSGQLEKAYYRQHGIKHFIYRYSAGDGNPLRILVVRRNNKLQAVLVKFSDVFWQNLQLKIPAKLLVR